MPDVRGLKSMYRGDLDLVLLILLQTGELENVM